MEKGTQNILKVAIVGPESTGKSVLTEEVSAALGVPFVMEYARIYLKDLDRPYGIRDVIRIAHGQKLLELESEDHSSPVLICDTNMLVCKIWAEFVFGYLPHEIEHHWFPGDYDLHLLTYPDLPWEPDPLREHPEKRKELFALYEDELKRAGVVYEVIQGTGKQRTTQALEAIKKHLNRS